MNRTRVLPETIYTLAAASPARGGGAGGVSRGAEG
jgi:hypothetical protein